MALILFIIGLAIIIATIIFLSVVHFNRFEKFTDIFQYWLDPRYRLLYDAYVYYKKSQTDMVGYLLQHIEYCGRFYKLLWRNWLVATDS